MASGSPCGAPRVAGPHAKNELNEEVFQRLQEQLLEDKDFAADMRALLLARFRAKHRGKASFLGADRLEVGGGDHTDDAEESESEEEEDSHADSEPDPSDARRLEQLGYKLQNHERLLSNKQPRALRRKGYSSEAGEPETLPPASDEKGLLQKLEELKYSLLPGMRRVPFIETLAIAAGDDVIKKDDSGDPAEAADDLKREAAFFVQVKETVPVALGRLHALGLQFTRPSDYMAEMLKSDVLMGRVRASIQAEQDRQRQFEAKRNQRYNKKFNRLAGHQLIREQEEARRRNLQLKAIDQWSKERRAAVREGTATQEAEEEFDKWLQGNEKEQEAIKPNHGLSFKQKDKTNRKQLVHRPHRKRGGRSQKTKGRGGAAGHKRNASKKQRKRA